MAHAAPPLQTVTAGDRGGQVTLVTVVLIIFTGAAVIARAGVRYRVARAAPVARRPVGLDDGVVGLALALAVAQSVCVQLAVNHGLGRHQNALSPAQVDVYTKAAYVAQILAVLVMAGAKFALLDTIRAIQARRPIRLACWGLAGVVAAWALSAVFALAFQCALPQPWLVAPARCIDLVRPLPSARSTPAPLTPPRSEPCTITSES